jgi:peptide/nickel transport system permease protein
VSGLALDAQRRFLGGGALRGAGERWARLGWIDRFALVFMAILVVGIVAGPFLAPYSETKIVGKSLTPPGPGFLLGLDEQGRDIFSRVLIGARASFVAAVLVIASGILIGGAIGLIAGIAGGWLDTVLMRGTDVFLALPGVLIALGVAAALGPGLGNTVVAIMVVWWPWYARIVRGEVRALMSRPHVEAAQLGGAGPLRVAWGHVLPGTVAPVVIAASLDVGALLLTLAGLSFLGLGSPPPSAELGSMTARGLKYIFTAWWIPAFPALAVFVMAFASNLAGDAIRNLQDS